MRLRVTVFLSCALLVLLLYTQPVASERRSQSLHRQHYGLRRRQRSDRNTPPTETPPITAGDQAPPSAQECEQTNKPHAATIGEKRLYGKGGAEPRTACVDRAEIEDMRRRGIPFRLASESNDRQTFERLRALKPGEAPGGTMGLYHDYGEMMAFLRAMHATHPELVRIHSLGATLGNREILAVQLTRDPDVIHPGRPRVKFVANIHGNEAVGRELLLHFVQDLATRYTQRERRVMRLLNATEVWVVPSVNPDGFETGTRTNAADRDLNRDYPDQYTGTRRCVQPETRAIMEWSLDGPGAPFSLSLALHGGELVVNYPFDGNADFRSGQPSLSQDDAEFRTLSLAYAQANPDIRDNGRRFPDGITNGAEWYVLNGGSQDWNYLEAGCMEVTAEVSHRKFPDDADLAAHWAKNREALLSFAEQIHEHGVWGYVLDADTGGPVRNARVYVAERPRGAHSPTDRYYASYRRYLLEGRHTLVASAEGYTSDSKMVQVPRAGTMRVDFMLTKQQQQHSANGSGSRRRNMPPACV